MQLKSLYEAGKLKGEEGLEALLENAANEDFVEMILSGPRKDKELFKVVIRLYRNKGDFYFQAEEFRGKQVFHKNLPSKQMVAYAKGMLLTNFSQGMLLTKDCRCTVLVGKRGTVTLKVRKREEVSENVVGMTEASGQHNRKKHYILEEGTPVGFLIDLGVMTKTGQVVKSYYDKFRQINRFLEFIRDILPQLPRDRRLTVIDFGCGKSYLTFAVYYYLHELNGFDVQIIGLDLKKNVIETCNALSEKYGYDMLRFYQGDIADYDGVESVDMVITLHACDTATDFALAKAVKWKARVILSVPCCQHELNGQIENELLEPVLSYGIIKERMAALYTDALRAQLLESKGYRTQILEFIDMEHTPKNLLIRAVYTGRRKDNEGRLDDVCAFLHLEPTLKKLLEEEGNGPA